MKCLILLATFAYTAWAACPNAWTRYGDVCYSLYTNPTNWLDASVAVLNEWKKCQLDKVSYSGPDIGSVLTTDSIAIVTQVHALCREFGGHLASLNTKQRNENAKQFLEYMDHKTRVWIGASDFFVDGFWTWDMDKRPFNYTDWAPGQPDGSTPENCLMMGVSTAYRWHDARCRLTNDFLCERPSV